MKSMKAMKVVAKAKSAKPKLGGKTRTELAAKLARLLSGEDDEHVLKKPACVKRPAAAKANSRATKEPKGGCTQSDDDDEGGGERTDRNKNNFFCKNQDELPPALQDMLAKTGSHKGKDIINNVVKRKADDNGWEWNLEHPMIVNKITKYEDNRSSEILGSMGQVEAEVCYGGAAGLDRAVATNEVKMKEVDDRNLYWEKKSHA